MATTLDDLLALRPADTLPVLGVPEIFRAIIDYVKDSTDTTSGVTVQSPVGIVTPFAGSVAPTGWLFCDGSSISNVNYPELFNVIGTTYGGTGATNFYLPDSRRHFILGAGGTKLFTAVESSSYDDGAQTSDNEVNTTVGSKGGEEKHVLLQMELPAVSVEAITPVQFGQKPFGEGTTSVNQANNESGQQKLGLSSKIGGGLAMSLMPPSLVLNYIIKAKP